MPAKPKRGVVPKSEKEAIRALVAAGVSPASVARRAGRSEETVLKTASPPPTPSPTPPPGGPGPALRDSPRWPQIRAAFDAREQAVYETEWAAWLDQLGADVTHSEKDQVHQAVTYGILRDRNLKDQRALRDRLAEAQAETARLLKAHPDAEDRPAAAKARLLAAAGDEKAAAEGLTQKTRELDSITTRLSGLVEDLKAKRDQRLDRVAERTANFMDLIRALADADRREAEGRRAEMMRMATLKKADELGRPHKFADGTWDRPILTHETVDLGSEAPPDDPA